MKKTILLAIFLFAAAFHARSQTVIFDHCESLTGWQGGGNLLALDTSDPQEGASSISTTGSNTERFRRSLTTPFNTGILASELTNAYLQFSLYVSDVTKFNASGGQFEISSAGGGDVDEYNWGTQSVNLRNGWNNVTLRLSAAGKMGTPNLSAINYFRYYKGMSASVVTKIDNIRFSKGYVGSELTGAHIFNSADAAADWTGTDAVQVDNGNKILGSGSLSKSGAGANWFTYQPAAAFNTTTTEEHGLVKFWLYVSDVSMFSGAGNISISSSAQNAYQWDLAAQNLLNGWNHVILRMTEASKTGTPNLNAINYFTVNQPLSASVTARIDEIEFYEPALATTTNPADNTLDGKVMYGYQGWFGIPSDGAANQKHNWWLHWFGTGAPDYAGASFDMWPYTKDYKDSDMAATNMTYNNGVQAKLYSSDSYSTVDAHFKWMQESEVDGVFQQRFLSTVRTTDWRLSNHFYKVLENVQTASAKYDRVYAIMYDLSGADATSTEAVIADWKRLVDEKGVTSENSYLWHNGRPLVALWGLGLASNVEATAARSDKLVKWFKNGDPNDPTDDPKYRATVMGGLNDSWKNHSAEWLAVYDQLDVISPWSVGRYSNEGGANTFAINKVRPEIAYTESKGIDYMPVIFPGFSWFNLQTLRNNPGAAVKNQIRRNGGSFLWQQSQNVINEGAKMIYLAMFDEVDEATSFYKMAKFSEHAPTGGNSWFLTLDADGYDLSPDWYMALSGYTKKVLSGKATNSLSVPLFPNVISTTAGNPLPVTLSRFTASTENNLVQLNWETAQESNSSHFEIQRSKNGTTFQTIGQIVSHNNSSDLQRYTFPDPDLPGGKYYYRLKMVDKDGSVAFSRIVAAEIVTSVRVNVYPNPVSDELEIESEQRILSIEVINALGITIYSKVPKGRSSEINTSRWQPGIYIVRVDGAERKIIKK
jgi:hypothetical protein